MLPKAVLENLCTKHIVSHKSYSLSVTGFINCPVYALSTEIKSISDGSIQVASWTVAGYSEQSQPAVKLNVWGSQFVTFTQISNDLEDPEFVNPN